MKRLLQRLARTSAGEIRFRCRETASLAAETLRYAGGAQWKRTALAGRLRPLSPELAAAHAALTRQDWGQAGRSLRSHFVLRPPRFVVDPSRRQDLARTIRDTFPGSVTHSSARADRLLAGRYDLLGYRDLSFEHDGTIDWHVDPVHDRRPPKMFWSRVPYLDPRIGDHKIIWELNRHQHWLALGRAAWLTGDSRYVSAVGRELESWLNANPPLTGINWSSMLELGFRSISWTWALHLCAPFDDDGDAAWFVDLLLGLDRQLDHLARHLSFYFSPNTHLLGEALALYVCGRAVPELRSASRWERLGRDVLVREAIAQVHTDGGHVELSPHYHRYALDFYLLALAVARTTNDPVAETFHDVASRLATFCRALADDHGRLPTIGDDDGGMLFPICGRPAADAADSLSLAANLLRRPELSVSSAPEETLWMLGDDRAAPQITSLAPASRLFPDTGYAVLRSAAGHAVFDAGHHGFLNGGHAHADALSVVLSVDGRPLLIDPGTATYTMDAALRDRFRSTAMHNTVTIDGRSQSVPSGPFRWDAPARARVDLWRSTPDFDCVEALHDGYAPVVHRRCVMRVGDDLWLIADHLLGAGHHEAAAHWHVDPAWIVTAAPDGETRFAHPEGLHAAIASTPSTADRFHGDAGSLGWYAPVYGQVLPSTTLRFSASGDAPMSHITGIAANTSPVRLALHRATVSGGREDGWHRAAVWGTLHETQFVALFCAPVGPASARRSQHAVSIQHGQMATDARIAVLRLSEAGDPLTLSLLGVRAVAWEGPGAFTIPETDEPRDLHLDKLALGRYRSVGVDARTEIDRNETRQRMVVDGVRRVG